MPHLGKKFYLNSGGCIPKEFMKVGLKFVDKRASSRTKIDEKGDYIVVKND